MSKDIEETWVNIPANPAAKSAQSNKADTNDISEILDHAYTLGKTDALLNATDYPTIMPKMKAKASNILAQETNKARQAQIYHDSVSLSLDGNGYDFTDTKEVAAWRKDRLEELEMEAQLTADKEQTP